MLFKLSRGDVDTDLYIYSETDDEKEIRQAFAHQDQGDMPWEEYMRTAKEGEISWVQSLEDVSQTNRRWMPYTTELSEDQEDLYSGLTIEDFFSGQA